MFRFFLKKNFCNIWENLFYVLVCNLFSLVALLVSYFLIIAALSVPGGQGLRTVLYFLAIIFDSVLIGSVGFAHGTVALKVANFESSHFKDFFAGFKESFKDALLSGIMLGVLVSIVRVCVPFYFNMFNATQNYLWFVLLMVIVWFLITTILALQYFLPLRTMFHNKILTCLKKCYIVFFDNLGFSLALFLVNILNTAITVFTFGLAPGTAGIVITNTNALRLLMYKYDWWEVNPDLTPKERRRVPWDDLLQKDKRLVGTIRELFFPWKSKK